MKINNTEILMFMSLINKMKRPMNVMCVYFLYIYIYIYVCVCVFVFPPVYKVKKSFKIYT